MSDYKLRAGVVGVGNIGQSAHLPAYSKNPDTQLVAICDIDEKRLAMIGERYGISKEHQYTDYRKMYATENLDVVSIGTPTYLHYAQTMDALDAKIHVMCEKPMAMNVQETVEMVRKAEAAGLVLSIGFNNRFRLDSSTLKSYIDNGLFGDIYYAKAGWLRRRGNPHGWFTKKELSGGGPLIDCGVHSLDLAHWLMGQPQPVSVLASTYCKFGDYHVEGIGQYWAMSGNEEGVFDTEDLAAAMIKFDNGATMMFDVSWALNGRDTGIYVQVYGDQAGANLSPFEIYGQLGNNLVDMQPMLNLSVNAQEAKVANFVDAIKGEAKLLCAGREAIVIAQIIDAIYESGETGKAVTVEKIEL
ncbi:MAG: Gfo/Idh/MocA family oxidoreductase [Limnochordia bacterium]|jgi:predicted dehydrogenase|nr:Gfo/Idh/MocA family oxidoreductase [Limnochordia bacterium]MDD2629944.1 Gfo/Idh/MocA family oxidoreductase [Limnochordia bacterium]MDD4518643.1 Gfo/Idh/MocA family oxidoreductase [Limnochordia bacterium]